MGKKNEIAAKGDDRGYIYQIRDHSDTVRSVVLGKFSLFASMAVELYRREFHENPSNAIPNLPSHEILEVIGNTNWFEIYQGDGIGMMQIPRLAGVSLKIISVKYFQKQGRSME